MTPAELKAKGARTIYAQKTIDGRGAPRQVDDTSKVQGFMIDNGDGTYSNFLHDGTLEKTYKPNNGFFGGLSQNLEAIGSDQSGVLSNFVAPALAMGYGASLINGAAPVAPAASSGLLETATVAPEVSAFTGAMPVEAIGATGTGATGVSAGVGAGAAGVGAGVGSGAGAGLLSGLGTAGTVMAAGGLLGALAGKDTQTTASSSKDPWGPAQPYLIDNLKRNAAMQDYYTQNPFSQEQKTAYQGLLNSVANGQANAPVMSGIANNFMGSNRGRMAQMPQFTQGTTAAPINWAQYANIGKV